MATVSDCVEKLIVYHEGIYELSRASHVAVEDLRALRRGETCPHYADVLEALGIHARTEYYVWKDIVA